MEQSHLARFIHGFTAGVNLKLAVNLLDMSGHRVRRDRQNLADFIERDNANKNFIPYARRCRISVSRAERGLGSASGTMPLPVG